MPDFFNWAEHEVNFNYLGQFDQIPDMEWVPFRIAREAVGPEQSPKSSRTALLYIVGIVSGGAMHWRWLYSRNMYKRRTVNKLAKEYLQELRQIIKEVSPQSVSTSWERMTALLMKRRKRG